MKFWRFLWARYRTLQSINEGFLISIGFYRSHFKAKYNIQTMGGYKKRQRKYAKISVKKRQELIKMVFQQGKTQHYAANKLSIKLETAKLIIKKYRTTGTFFMKKMPKYKKKEANTVQNQQLIENRSDIQKISYKSLLNVQSSHKSKAEEPPAAQHNICYFYYPFDFNFVSLPAYSMI